MKQYFIKSHSALFLIPEEHGEDSNDDRMSGLIRNNVLKSQFVFIYRGLEPDTNRMKFGLIKSRWGDTTDDDLHSSLLQEMLSEVFDPNGEVLEGTKVEYSNVTFGNPMLFHLVMSDYQI